MVGGGEDDFGLPLVFIFIGCVGIGGFFPPDHLVDLTFGNAGRSQQRLRATGDEPKEVREPENSKIKKDGKVREGKVKEG